MTALACLRERGDREAVGEIRLVTEENNPHPLLRRSGQALSAE